MPTPRPIMVASVGAMSGTPNRWPTQPDAGQAHDQADDGRDDRHAHRDELPNARLRMTIATMIPTSSLLSVSGVESSEPIEPPAADLDARRLARASRRRRGPPARLSSSRSAERCRAGPGMKAVFSSFGE